MLGRYADLREQRGRRLQQLGAQVVTGPAVDLRVGALADQAQMAPRSFARAYREVIGTTPARAMERLRIEAASRLLAEVSERPQSLAQIAYACGFGCLATFRRAFRRHWGMNPAFWREMMAAGRSDVTEDTEKWLVDRIDTIDKRLLVLSVHLDRQVAFMVATISARLDRLEQRLGLVPQELADEKASEGAESPGQD